MLKKPRVYKEVLFLLVESTIESLKKSKKSIEVEISNLVKLKEALEELRWIK